MAVWNSSDKSANIVLSNGNLTATSNDSASWHGVRSDTSFGSGKYYWEIIVDAIGSQQTVGIATSGPNLDGVPNNQTSNTLYIYNSDGTKSNGGSSSTAYGDAYTTGDVISVALDTSAGKIWFAKNGVWQGGGDPGAGTGEAYASISGTFFHLFSTDASGGAATANFGATTSWYEPPTGYITHTTESVSVDYLVVGGGGSTTDADPVGGGGGEVLTGSQTVYSTEPWTITVAAADAKSYALYQIADQGTSGGVSGSGNTVGANGTNSYGGGAGDSANGGNGGLQIGGNGGAGTSSSISGSSIEYGGGGGGSADITGGGATGGGGSGGGGGAGGNGSANTGGGAGGCWVGSATGGTGIVIISAPQGLLTATGGTHTTSGGKDIWTFTASGTWTPTIVFTPTIQII